MASTTAEQTAKAAQAVRRAGPYVRRAMTDKEFRDDLRRMMRSAGRLAGDVAGDGRGPERLRRLVGDSLVRGDVQALIGSALNARQRLTALPAPRRSYLPIVLIGTGVVIGGAITVLLMYPRSRQRIVAAAQDTRERTLHLVRRDGDHADVESDNVVAA
jgi:hypothetical protein